MSANKNLATEVLRNPGVGVTVVAHKYLIGYSSTRAGGALDVEFEVRHEHVRPLLEVKRPAMREVQAAGGSDDIVRFVTARKLEPCGIDGLEPIAPNDVGKFDRTPPITDPHCALKICRHGSEEDVR
jgi:hypothetical protein